MVSSDLGSAIKSLVEHNEAFKDVFIVEVKVSASGGGHRIAVFADTDEGITIDLCTAISRFLAFQLEDRAMVDPENYSLDVSSPGIDKPLLLLRQYVKNIGRTLNILTKTGEKIQGVLKQVSEGQIVLANRKKIKNKYELIETTVGLADIKTAVVTVAFGGEPDADEFNA